MTPVERLLRPDLQAFAGYRSARGEALDGAVWLNANEAAEPNAFDIDGTLRRYPDPQPEELRAALAALYDCAPGQLLVGRGSDEAIDLLVRAFCTAGRDAVLVTPPVFGMYAVCARLQGAQVLEVPLLDDGDDFALDFDAVADMVRRRRAKVVFLCSPGNPAGGVLPADAVLRLARMLQDQALVVVDEAYVEYADAPSLASHVAGQANLAILRTLSKAHALAGARVGCLIADPAMIAALRRCQAPYPVPAPSARLALQALSGTALATTVRNVVALKSERARLRDSLIDTPGVRRVHPSQTNFLLVRFADAEAAFRRLLSAGVVVRDVRNQPQLDDALRITVGTAAQNAVVVDVLRSQIP